MTRTLRELWDSKTVTLGGWCHIADSFTTEVMASAGFDWVCVDMQHGLAGQGAMIPMLQAAAAASVPSVVRVPWNEPAAIMRALDGGANGVIIPMVNTADDALAAVRATRYFPDGFRSWGPTRIALRDPLWNATWGNASTLCIVMIETPEAVSNVDRILEVDGIDAVFVGPSDLALSSGLQPTLRVTEDAHLSAIESVLHSAQRHDAIAGIYCGGVEMARKWAESGFQMLAVASDLVFLRTAVQAAVQELSQLSNRQAQPVGTPK